MSSKQIRTQRLDDAMKELIDICQEIESKPLPKNPNAVKDTEENRHLRLNKSNYERLHNVNDLETCLQTIDCDKFRLYKETNIINDIRFPKIKTDQNFPDNHPKMDCDPIERLQIRQSQLQKQLDDHLAVARNLEIKQRRRLDSSLKISSPDSHQRFDEDDELIEFQQIENELKLTELNRQLTNIQEELRLTLYKRLLQNSKSTSKFAQDKNESRQMISNQPPSMRRNSAQTDESTPSSSSCSDEQTAISSNISPQPDVPGLYQELSSHSNPMIHNNNSFDLIDQSQEQRHTDQHSLQSSSTSCTGELFTADRDAAIETNSDAGSVKSNYINPRQKSNNIPASIRESSEISAILEQMNNFEISVSAGNQYASLQKQLSVDTHDNQEYFPYAPKNSNQYQLQSSLFVSASRVPTSSTSKDLERIDEGEEEDQDHCSPNKLRTIYEEKLSPILRAGAAEKCFPYKFSSKNDGSGDDYDTCRPEFQSLPIQIEATCAVDAQQISSPKANYDKFNPCNVNSAKRLNRPLTIYLPKQDENIDLIDHIQALGHDISLISDDLKLDRSTACGYLYKSCSYNSKKRMKRFFYFDRDEKTLSYYENEEQLVKKNCPPKNKIPFDEISDVYVDHGLSNVSKKQKDSKKSSYVFVLATTKRKYVLSSSRAETMRAWIDILFSAARANDYFQQLDDCPDDSFEPPYTSINGD